MMWTRATRPRFSGPGDLPSKFLPDFKTSPWSLARNHTSFFLHAHVFDVGGDVPLVAEGIDHAAAAIAIGMVLGRRDRGRACAQCALVESVAVFHVKIEHGRHGLVGAV